MQYSVGVEYALHSLFYMTDFPKGTAVGIKELSKLNNISETYLSKIFTKLKRAEIVTSVSGVKGGYELARDPYDISFWDVVEAVEGSQKIFNCVETRQNNILTTKCENSDKCPCLIKIVMHDAEEEMRNYLKQKSLGWLVENVMPTFSTNDQDNIKKWIDDKTSKNKKI